MARLPQIWQLELQLSSRCDQSHFLRNVLPTPHNHKPNSPYQLPPKATPAKRNYRIHARTPHNTHTTHTTHTSSNGPSQGIPRDAARVRQGRPPVHHQVQQAYASNIPFSSRLIERERGCERIRIFADMCSLYNSRQARVPAHLAGRRDGFLDHGCYWLHCQAE